MGRGIFAGLMWGVVVGLGIVTVANQVVDKVYVSPVSLSSNPANADVSPKEMAHDMTSEQPAQMAQATDTMIAPEVPKVEDTQDPEVVSAQPVEMDAVAASEAASDEMAISETAKPDLSDAVPDDAVPGEVAPNAPFDILPEAIDETAPLPSIEAAPVPSFETPSSLGAPTIDANTTPDIQGDSPVISSPQALELAQPITDTAPVQAGADLPEQKTAPIELPVTAQAEAEMEGSASLDATQAGQSIAEAISVQDDAIPAVTPKIVPQGQQTLGTKVSSFTDREDTMKSTRLPSVTGSAMADAAPVIAAEDLPAIIAFSADFTKSTAAPEMSVILVDIGALDPTSPQLANLPFPVTFAVDALAPGAAERAQLYRTAGLEVLSLIGLPDGATAQDVAMTINQARDLVPVSIGFLDVPSASFQSTRDVAAQVVASAASSGHGLVSFSSGLNALMQEATRANTPAALVFRDFDGRDQNLAAIKRFLDQAAFRAGIDEDIILVGRAKEDTVKALVEWSLGNRAATVELVPVSYLLTHGDDVAQ